MIIGAHEQTLRHWANTGALEVMKTRKPHIVHGSHLIECLDARKPKKRPKLPPGEFDCWSCKTRGLPFGLMADYTPMTPKTGRLSALCGACESDVGTLIGTAGLARYAEILEIVNSAK